VLPPDRQEHVERLARRTVVRGRPSGVAPNPAAQPWLLAVQRAVAERRVVRLAYRARGQTGETHREVEPLGVVFYGGAWYLVAWCRLRTDVRHFRVDRVQRLEMLAEACPPRPDFSLARHLEEEVSRDDTELARVWFSAAALERARQESYATLVEETVRDGGAEVSLCTFSFEWLARWLLSFGNEAEAVAPAQLRELVRRTAGEIAERHGGATARPTEPQGRTSKRSQLGLTGRPAIPVTHTAR
jgi:predicted DNA-binding transcriptional regulator YafY